MPTNKISITIFTDAKISIDLLKEEIANTPLKDMARAPRKKAKLGKQFSLALVPADIQGDAGIVVLITAVPSRRLTGADSASDRRDRSDLMYAVQTSMNRYLKALSNGHRKIQYQLSAS